jgi:DNA-binding protein HU-beta
MKANKALKRLNKIEALISDVTERYLARAPHIRDVLQDAKAAVTRAKEAVSLQASSGAAKNPPVKHSKPTSKATPEISKPKRKLSAAGRKAIIAATKKRWALKRAEAAKTATKNAALTPKKGTTKRAAIKAAPAKAATETAPLKKAVKKSAAKKAAPAPAQTVAQAAGQ